MVENLRAGTNWSNKQSTPRQKQRLPQFEILATSPPIKPRRMTSFLPLSKRLRLKLSICHHTCHTLFCTLGALRPPIRSVGSKNKKKCCQEQGRKESTPVTSNSATSLANRACNGTARSGGVRKVLSHITCFNRDGKCDYEDKRLRAKRDCDA